MDEAILDVVLQVHIAAHCSSIRPHNLAFSVARSPDIKRSQRYNTSSDHSTQVTSSAIIHLQQKSTVQLREVKSLQALYSADVTI